MILERGAPVNVHSRLETLLEELLQRGGCTKLPAQARWSPGKQLGLTMIPVWIETT